MGTPKLTTVVVFVALSSACADYGEFETERSEVINGDQTPDGMFPSVGAIMVEYNNGDVSPICTGTLISQTAVLTAAHCVDTLLTGSRVPGFTFAHDALSLTRDDVYWGSARFQYPDFDLFAALEAGVNRWDDIGLLLFDEPITEVAPMPMPTPDEAELIVEDDTVDIVGYGLTEIDDYASYGVKHHGEAVLVELGEYEMLIAEPDSIQNCNGDSGGPAFAQLDGRTRVIGAVSRSPDTNPTCDHGGIDTRVDAYLPWIAEYVDDIPCGGLWGDCGDIAGPAPDPSGGCQSSATSGWLFILGVVVFTIGWRRRRNRRA